MHQGEVSNARQVLFSQAKAPGNQATLNELRDPERRPPQLSEAIPPETNSSWIGGSTLATSAVHPEVQQLGWHLKVLLDDEQAILLIT